MYMTRYLPLLGNVLGFNVLFTVKCKRQLSLVASFCLDYKNLDN